MQEPIPLLLSGRLNKSLEHDTPPIQIVGMHSSATLALYLTQSEAPLVHNSTHLVVTPDQSTAEQFCKSARFFNPSLDVHLLPEFDVGVYSNLYPNQRVIAQRLRWLFNAKNSLPGALFVSSFSALAQKTLPYSQFSQSTRTIERGSELDSAFWDFLKQNGYTQVPTCEDVGTFAVRGGILDIFSPSNNSPYRIELFGNSVESIRFFDPSTQMSFENTTSCVVLPAREVLFSDDNRQNIAKNIQRDVADRDISKEELSEVLRAASQGVPFYGHDFLLPYFYKKLDSPLDYFSQPISIWIFDYHNCQLMGEEFGKELSRQYDGATTQLIRPHYDLLYSKFSDLFSNNENKLIHCEKIDLSTVDSTSTATNHFSSTALSDFSAAAKTVARDNVELSRFLNDRFEKWRAQNQKVIICASSQNSAERLISILEKTKLVAKTVSEVDFSWSSIFHEQESEPRRVHILYRTCPESFRVTEEGIVFLRDEDIFGKKRIQHEVLSNESALDKSDALSFGELEPGNFVVHRMYGIGIYEGLKVMAIDGADAEFLELKYKDNDRLYLPVYRVAQLHRYTGPQTPGIIDKLGTNGWSKTKIKVRNQTRDVANKLLQLYAKRSQIKRPPFSSPDDDYFRFENSFPYQETKDQLSAIHTVLNDLTGERPMDRLICGDVGFGKTEVALRAAFKAVEDKRQVAIIAPTTILTLQHFETFKKRLHDWPIEVRVLNRFISAEQVKKTVADLKSGSVDIVIGTHRLLSKDIQFKNLGLLIVDEEQKFGVVHKEKLRYMRENVDTLALSATPIPRTLNMSLVGIRDLSIINTPPEDRLPTRTYVCKYDEDTIRKAITNEIARGGQVFFLHNRVQTIEETTANIRELVPTARIAYAHGQMEEDLLEKTMMRFFHHEIDVLVCTAIIESGMDIPKANTIFIDQAHTFGVSQLYQLRGRVGRSKERAYCYLLMPAGRKLDSLALERLKVIQDNTALGSGLKVAQHDLELRGAGDILGENQSGHINAVGYELYIELLQEALAEQSGREIDDRDIEPEINLRVPALLPDKYVPDIRMRLYYYKILSHAKNADDIDRIENELRDQFGALPDESVNLLGLMLIRILCRTLGVRDVSASQSSVTFAFTEKTHLPPTEVVRLTTRENKKYSLTHDQRIRVRMNNIKWSAVVDELEYLLGLCPKTQQ